MDGADVRPFVLDTLRKIPADFYEVMGWAPVAGGGKQNNKQAPPALQYQKDGFVLQLDDDATMRTSRDALDESTGRN